MDSREFRDLGHRVVDLLAAYLDQIEEKRVFPDVAPGTVNQLFREPLPVDPSSPNELLDEIEHFFISYNEMRGRVFTPIGRFGPRRALKLIKQGMKAFKKKSK